jgi:tetratricopeptide (TPR) repeat protein
MHRAVLVVWALSSIGGTAPAADREPLFEGLGSYGRKVTTTSADAQRYFDQGLCFLYAFNHEEAIRSFRQAAELDPSCAMAWWGIAIANGPHINRPVVDKDHGAAAWAAVTRARGQLGNASSLERALIDAVAARYADVPPEDRKPLDQAYADKMRLVWTANRDDPDVGALCAEALMTLRPWDLWTHEGKPQPGTDNIVAMLDEVLALAPRHPLALHLYIHAVEASPHPEKSEGPADRLRDLQPGLGHLVHMPSHIDVRRGRWKQAAITNDRAIEADAKYLDVRSTKGFYGLYMIHNHHMLAYAAMMRGEGRRACAAIDTALAGLPADWAREHAAIADGYLMMPQKVRMRFGRWDEILAAPEPDEAFPVARTLRHYLRGVAHAAQGKVDEARVDQSQFVAAKARVPEAATAGLNKAADLLAVAEHFLAGEVLYRAGSHDEGIAELTEAVRCEDALKYAEPPDWIEPVRHALGAALLQSGRHAEAERVYRDDLERLPENGWSLYGLARALELQGKRDEAKVVQARFQKCWEDADVKLVSSCFCQPGV